MNKFVIFLFLVIALAIPFINAEEDTDCTDNADCESGQFLECKESKCRCMEGLKWTGDNCTIPYDEPCKDDEDEPQCNENGRQACIEGRCSCEDEDMKHDRTADKCFLLAGAVCEEDEQCYTNSECEFTGSSENGTCTCLDSFPPNNARECLRSRLEPCAPDMNLCNFDELLTCNPETFRCDCAIDTGYDEDAKKCVKPLGALCTLDAECPFLASCKGGMCACGDDLVAGKEGKCVIPYEGACKSTSGPSCDLAGKQYCNGASCACVLETEMEFFVELNSCYIPKGNQCFVSTNCLPDLVCDPNSKTCACDSEKGLADDDEGECKISFGFPCEPVDQIGQCNSFHKLVCDPTARRCECKDTYDPVERQDNTAVCVGRYEAKCTQDGDCNRGDSLRCDTVAQVCRCFYSSQRYDPATGKCYSFAGGVCDLEPSDPDRDPRITCGANMDCIPRENERSECQCKEGYLQIGTVCSYGNVNLPGFALMLISGILVFMKLDVIC